MKEPCAAGPRVPRRFVRLLLAAALGAAVPVNAVAQAPPSENVELAPGAPAVSVAGLVDQRAQTARDYVVAAEAGQTLNVELTTRNPLVHFDVIPPGSVSEPALVNSSISGERRWSGELPSTGDYTVRVYMMRSSNRQRSAGSYTLTLSIEQKKRSAELAGELAGTAWQLVRVQAKDETSVMPGATDRAKYTLFFARDGKLSFRADCNRGQTTWSSQEGRKLTFGPLAMLTKAACLPGSFHDRFVRDLTFVRSYELQAGKLYLSLLADGGVYEFEPVAPASVATEGPSFDCAKATRDIEKTICNDAALSALDRKLASVYAEAAMRAGGPSPSWLEPAQATFMRRRNECSRSDERSACITRVYDERITELQVMAGLVGRRGPTAYDCKDQGGRVEQVDVVFHQSHLPSAQIRRGDQTVLAMASTAGSGAKYEGPSVTFWDKGGAARLSFWGTELSCTAR